MNEILTMKNLRECFNEAIEDGAKFIGVQIQMEGFEKPEIIINPYENFENKLAYYEKAYNEDLTLKTFNEIKIVNFTYGLSFNGIQCMLGIKPYYI